MRWEVNTNTFYQANTATVEFALRSLNKDQQLDFWAAQRDMTIEIYAGFLSIADDPNEYSREDLSRIFYGTVDDFAVDVIQQKLNIRCRDLTSRLIDVSTYKKYKDMTSSEVAEALAKEHDLKPVVTATTTPTGEIYRENHTLIETERSQWDVLTYLAQSENYLTYVEGETLYFVPKGDETQGTFRLHWQPENLDQTQWSNAIKISFRRSLSLSREVVVKVRSWNRSKRKGYTLVVKATGKKRTGSPITTYVVRRGNLTEEQALALGQQKLKEITEREIRLTATLPGDTELSPRSVIRMTGTESELDQNYFPESVVRSFDAKRGYLMEIQAKNSSATTQVVG